MAKRYAVIVGNVGEVYSGESRDRATAAFDVYVEQSKAEVGRAGGESVYLTEDGEPAREHVGSLDAADCGAPDWTPPPGW